MYQDVKRTQLSYTSCHTLQMSMIFSMSQEKHLRLQEVMGVLSYFNIATMTS